MQTIEFDNLEFATDKDKAIPQLEHDFKPLKEDPDLVIRCTYFKSGELMSYLNMSTNGSGVSYRYRDIFADKVQHISGISVKDKKTGKVTPIEDAKTFLSYPGKGIFDQLVTIVTAHLITGEGLNETEVKNFN